MKVPWARCIGPAIPSSDERSRSSWCPAHCLWTRLRAGISSADARAAAALSHPNIATLFDVGEYDAGWYLAYEFAAGVTLREETGGQAVNPRRAVELAVQVADALADAHARGVLHGDLRPETIFVTKKGSAKILEFGMGHWTRGGQTRILAASRPESIAENAATTVSYMSPEQAGGGTVDARTDVFSLGVILYEMLSGRNPLAAPTAAETLARVVSSTALPHLPESALTPNLPALVARAVAKAVAAAISECRVALGRPPARGNAHGRALG